MRERKRERKGKERGGLDCALRPAQQMESKLHAYCSSELGSIDSQHNPPARDGGGGLVGG